MPKPSDDITRMLNSMESASSEDLIPLVYEELRRLAQSQMHHERAGHTLQPTALVHEAFLRLGSARDPKWKGRRHYFAAAAEAMRRILIDQANRKRRVKHGGDRQRADFEAQEFAIAEPTEDILAADAALTQLEAVDPRAREIVNLRFFVGLTIPETAEAMGVSESTIEREWRFLRTYLRKALDEADQ